MQNQFKTKLMLAMGAMASVCLPAYAADTAPGWFRDGMDILGFILYFVR